MAQPEPFSEKVPRVITVTLLALLGFSIIALHVLAIVQPTLIVGSHFVNLVAMPLLFIAMLVLPRKMKFSLEVWQSDLAYKWVTGISIALVVVETLQFAALMFNLLGRFHREWIAVDSNPTFRTLDSQLGHLMVFTVLAAGLFPTILIELRREICGNNE